MTEDTMAQARLLQVFLSRGGHGVYEVSVDLDGTRRLTCTCPGYGQRRKCKHVTFVAERLSPAGEYTVPIPQSAMSELQMARQSDIAWRAFVLRYLTPEVL